MFFSTLWCRSYAFFHSLVFSFSFSISLSLFVSLCLSLCQCHFALILSHTLCTLSVVLFKLTECDVLFDVVITVSLSLCEHFYRDMKYWSGSLFRRMRPSILWRLNVDAIFFLFSFAPLLLSKCKCTRFVQRLFSDEQNRWSTAFHDTHTHTHTLCEKKKRN